MCAAAVKPIRNLFVNFSSNQDNIDEYDEVNSDRRSFLEKLIQSEASLMYEKYNICFPGYQSQESRSVNQSILPHKQWNWSLVDAVSEVPQFYQPVVLNYTKYESMSKNNNQTLLPEMDMRNRLSSTQESILAVSSLPPTPKRQILSPRRAVEHVEKSMRKNKEKQKLRKLKLKIMKCTLARKMKAFKNKQSIPHDTNFRHELSLMCDSISLTRDQPSGLISSSLEQSYPDSQTNEDSPYLANKLYKSNHKRSRPIDFDDEYNRLISENLTSLATEDDRAATLKENTPSKFCPPLKKRYRLQSSEKDYTDGFDEVDSGNIYGTSKKSTPLQTMNIKDSHFSIKSPIPILKMSNPDVRPSTLVHSKVGLKICDKMKSWSYLRR